MLPSYLEDLVEEWELVGSRVTCNPPPTDTDQDILVLVAKDNLKTFEEELNLHKWVSDTKKQGKKGVPSADEIQYPPAPPFQAGDPSPEAEAAWNAWEAQCQALDDLWEAAPENKYEDLGDGAAFESWKLGELNIILTLEKEWFDKFMEASDCCKALNVMSKAERIAIFAKIVPKQLKEKAYDPVIASINNVQSMIQGPPSPWPNMQQALAASLQNQAQFNTMALGAAFNNTAASQQSNLAPVQAWFSSANLVEDLFGTWTNPSPLDNNF